MLGHQLHNFFHFSNAKSSNMQIPRFFLLQKCETQTLRKLFIHLVAMWSTAHFSSFKNETLTLLRISRFRNTRLRHLENFGSSCYIMVHCPILIFQNAKSEGFKDFVFWKRENEQWNLTTVFQFAPSEIRQGKTIDRSHLLHPVGTTSLFITSKIQLSQTFMNINDPK